MMSSGAWVDKYKLAKMCNATLADIEKIRKQHDVEFIKRKVKWKNFFRRLLRKPQITIDPDAKIDYEFWSQDLNVADGFAFPSLADYNSFNTANALLRACTLAEEQVFVSSNDLMLLDMDYD